MIISHWAIKDEIFLMTSDKVGSVDWFGTVWHPESSGDGKKLFQQAGHGSSVWTVWIVGLIGTLTWHWDHCDRHKKKNG